MRKPLTIAVDEEDEKVLRELCEVMGISMSQLFRDTVRGFVITAKATGILRKAKQGKISMLDKVKFMAKGMQQDPL